MPQFIFAGEVDAVHQTSGMHRLKGKKWDWGTTSHLVVNHNQCLAWTIFGHWSLQHHAGPAVLLSKHCAWQGQNATGGHMWVWTRGFDMEVLNFSAFSCASDLQVGCLVFTFLVSVVARMKGNFAVFSKSECFSVKEAANSTHGVWCVVNGLPLLSPEFLTTLWRLH